MLEWVSKTKKNVNGDNKWVGNNATPSQGAYSK